MPRESLYRAFRVVIRNKRNGPFLEWDMAGESAWPTLKGAESRRQKVARKFPQFDNGIRSAQGEFIVNYHEATHPHLAELKPTFPKKVRLTPHNPAYQRPQK